MSGKKKALLVLLMALLLLYGCGAGVRTEGIPAFERMEYRRPDVSEMERSVAAVKQALAEGKSFRTVTDALDACYEDYYHFLTMYNLAYIRSSRDLTDRRYAEEYAWCDEQLSRIGQLLEGVLYACGTSELAGKLEEDYFWEGFAQEYGDDSRAV